MCCNRFIIVRLHFTAEAACILNVSAECYSGQGVEGNKISSARTLKLLSQNYGNSDMA